MGKQRRSRRRATVAARAATVKLNQDRDAELAKSDDYVARLLNDARIAEDGDSRPRKHHLVPRSYLARWEDDGKLRMTNVDSRASHLASARRAARETDFYRLESSDLDPSEVPPLLAEIVLGEVERAGSAALGRLLSSGAIEPSIEDRFALARLIAYQYTRGRAYRERARAIASESVAMQYESATPEDIEAHVLDSLSPMDSTPEVVADAVRALTMIGSGEIAVAPQDAAVVGLALQHGEMVAPMLFSRAWRVLDTPAALVTCDEPVVLISGPGGDRATGDGLAGAGVIAYPLAPNKLLVLVRRDIPLSDFDGRLSHAELAEINREIVFNADRWAFERPSRRATLAIAPPARGKPVEVRRMVPVASPRPDVRTELVMLTHPTRWASEPERYWPVGRWWRWADHVADPQERLRRASFEAASEVEEVWELVIRDSTA